VISEMPVALTLLDLDGTILYFNDYATKILDRKPEYIGQDVRGYHKVPKSNDKIDRILAGYKAGDKAEHHWQLPREGRLYGVRVAPLVVNGETVGLIHTVQAQGEEKS
jgi:DUF438 domain-containing protein